MSLSTERVGTIPLHFLEPRRRFLMLMRGIKGKKPWKKTYLIKDEHGNRLMFADGTRIIWQEGGATVISLASSPIAHFESDYEKAPLAACKVIIEPKKTLNNLSSSYNEYRFKGYSSATIYARSNALSSFGVNSSTRLSQKWAYPPSCYYTAILPLASDNYDESTQKYNTQVYIRGISYSGSYVNASSLLLSGTWLQDSEGRLYRTITTSMLQFPTFSFYMPPTVEFIELGYASRFNSGSIRVYYGSNSVASGGVTGSSNNRSFGETVHAGEFDPLSGKLMITHTLRQASWGSMQTVLDDGTYAKKKLTSDSGWLTGRSASGYSYCNLTTTYSSQGGSGPAFYIGDDYAMVYLQKTTDSSRVVQILGKLREPIVRQLEPLDIRTLLGENNVFCFGGNIQVELSYYDMV